MARSRERGSQVVEVGLVLLPLCGFVFLILDMAWAFYVRATLQSAVREGVRYAITSQTMTGMGQDASNVLVPVHVRPERCLRVVGVDQLHVIESQYALRMPDGLPQPSVTCDVISGGQQMARIQAIAYRRVRQFSRIVTDRAQLFEPASDLRSTTDCILQ
jgi:hypothetical protein